MSTQQGDLALLNDSVAQQLFQSPNNAHLAYSWTDGTPRVVPVWFHWSGAEVLIWSPPTAPKLRALRPHSQVALTIDGSDWPIKVLLVRGAIGVTMEASDNPQYVLMVQRYLGIEQGRSWLEQYMSMFPQSARISVRPDWVGIIDMETRFPSAIEQVMESRYR